MRRRTGSILLESVSCCHNNDMCSLLGYHEVNNCDTIVALPPHGSVRTKCLVRSEVRTFYNPTIPLVKFLLSLFWSSSSIQPINENDSRDILLSLFKDSEVALRLLANLLMISGYKQIECMTNISTSISETIRISCLSSSETGPGWECGNICLLSHSPYQQLSQGSHQARIKGCQRLNTLISDWAERYEDGDRCCGTSGRAEAAPVGPLPVKYHSQRDSWSQPVFPKALSNK